MAGGAFGAGDIGGGLEHASMRLLYAGNSVCNAVSGGGTDMTRLCGALLVGRYEDRSAARLGFGAVACTVYSEATPVAVLQRNNYIEAGSSEDPPESGKRSARPCSRIYPRTLC